MGMFKRSGKKGDTWYIDYFYNGKRIQKGIGPSKKQAQAALGKITAEIREGRYFEKKKLLRATVDELIVKYQEWAKSKKSFKTTDAIHLVPIKRYFSGKLLSEITEYDVEAFRAERMDTPTRFGGRRSAATCNHELGTLKQVFNKGVAWGLNEKNPAAKVKPLRRNNGRVRFLTVEEAGRLLQAASRHLRPIIICALETGMRRGEILNLQWADVDMQNGMLYVRDTKNGEPRHVPTSARLRTTLAVLPRRLGCDYVFSGEQRIGRIGKPFHDVRTAFENACRKADIQDFRFHDLRHTAASYMVMANVPLRTVAEILGHKTVSMSERYSHLTPEHKRKAVDLLPNWEQDSDYLRNFL